ncbi:recombinase family protein [Brevundimonas aveniformis]|uniref:recombinase family protein n=1 Tax=Brevundimonas aveniformis TaxID=370977 RepID=UPI000403EAF1|nr:recombinase family protein [Brevundimonas aveniformis]
MTVRRCAIYTRKSSDEGLEQGFNSLHAQRDACEAYVRSQAGEGWKVIPTLYDDGGFSGGTMERPALRQLLADIERGLIDIVVVYKVDRLTRALSDFARIVETFDGSGVSFVSVTQAFNTTTSMGRLTLNVLLSFAQFEREVTGERIRDKIAASKQKGLWMGGGVPLGYDVPTDPTSRVLVVNEREAEDVRHIFRRYLELGTVRRLAADLRSRGVFTKDRVARSGRQMGGRPFKEGHLYYLLKNRTYLGEIVHRKAAYPGQHPAIVDRELFEKVQTLLAQNALAQRADRTPQTGQLTGRVFDDRGHPMSPVTSRRGPRIYRYYVSQAVIRSDRGEAGSLTRVPAASLERLVSNALIEETAGTATIEDVQRLEVGAKGLKLILPASLMAPGRVFATDGDNAIVHSDGAIGRVGGAKRAFAGDGKLLEAVGSVDAIQKALARAHRWAAQIANGERSGSDDIAKAEGLQSRYVDKLLRLAWLSPQIQEDILSSDRCARTLGDLIHTDHPLAWTAQSL